VGGGLSLLGVFWTLRRQEERDRKADERQLRDAKHSRLRTAYRDVVWGAYSYSHWAAAVGLTFAMVRKGHQSHEELAAVLNREQPDIGGARATLLLEAKEDRIALELTDRIGTLGIAFLGSLAESGKDEAKMPVEEYQRRLSSIMETAEDLAAHARQRLAELEEPV
jgi:hypothetical protein